MAKNKLQRFREMKDFPNVAEYTHNELAKGPHPLRGNWNRDFFKNNNPIVLELGCGKGEYTVNLARRFPDKNFIGLDVKGSRMYVGACMALDEKLTNAGFLRTRIDFINAEFGPNEIDEIWITFPDPQPHKPRKRLTSPLFLARYRQLLKPNGIIHLKTDSVLMHEFTRDVVAEENHHLLAKTANIYHDGLPHEAILTEIQTTYEKRFLGEGKPITYISFQLRSARVE